MDRRAPEFPQKLRAALARRRWFTRLTRDLQDEVAQDTLAALLDLKGREPDDALVYGLAAARNRAVYLLRRAQQRNEERSGEVLERIASKAASPEELASEAELLREAFLRLPPKQREVVLAVLGGGLTGDEVGQRLGISRDSVYKILSRALHRIRSQIDAPSVRSSSPKHSRK